MERPNETTPAAPEEEPQAASTSPPDAAASAEDVAAEAVAAEATHGGPGGPDPDAASESGVAAAASGGAEADEVDYLALAQRTQADFENFRKRAAKERAEAESRGVGKLARELLPSLDNLERAIAAAEIEEGDDEHHLTKGIRLVQGELTAALSRAGVEAFSPLGEPFDPNEHEAVSKLAIEDVASGCVAEVYQQGYRLNGTILRPARVVVAE